jgi:hypothetical protein
VGGVTGGLPPVPNESAPMGTLEGGRAQGQV